MDLILHLSGKNTQRGISNVKVLLAPLFRHLLPVISDLKVFPVGDVEVAEELLLQLGQGLLLLRCRSHAGGGYVHRLEKIGFNDFLGVSIIVSPHQFLLVGGRSEADRVVGVVEAHLHGQLG